MLLHGLVAALLGVAARPPLPVDPEGDPLALKDPFLELSGEELRTKWSLNANVEPAEPGDAELLSTPRPADSTLAARLSAAVWADADACGLQHLERVDALSQAYGGWAGGFLAGT